MQDKSDIRIRLAESKDIDGLTELHCKSFPPEEHIPVVFGKRYVRRTYKWLVTSESAYTLVAEENHKIIGLVAMCDYSFTLPMFLYCLPEFIVSILKNPQLLINFRLWKRMFRRPDVVSEISKRIVKYPKVAQMTIGAVDNTFRGRNIFPELINKTKVFSKERGSRAIRAGVYKWNMPCRRAFIKDGWFEVSELETSDTVFFMAFLDDSIMSELSLSY
jgi:hypothetical protein